MSKGIRSHDLRRPGLEIGETINERTEAGDILLRTVAVKQAPDGAMHYRFKIESGPAEVGEEIDMSFSLKTDKPIVRVVYPPDMERPQTNVEVERLTPERIIELIRDLQGTISLYRNARLRGDKAHARDIIKYGQEKGWFLNSEDSFELNKIELYEIARMNPKVFRITGGWIAIRRNEVKSLDELLKAGGLLKPVSRKLFMEGAERILKSFGYEFVD